MTESILEVKMKCPECMLITTVDLCEPDIDGDGSLGCPRCLAVDKKKIVVQELIPKLAGFTADILWEFSPDPAVTQLQEMMQYLLDKDVNA